MRRPCREVQQYIASGASELPSALHAHIAQCAKCQRAWRLEQAYQQSLNAARSEPVPACDLPWARIQARLAEQKAVERAPVWRRYAYAGGFAVALLAASLAWLARTPRVDAPALVATQPPVAQEDLSLRALGLPPAAFITERPVPPATPKQVASASSKQRPTRRAQTGAPATPAQKTDSRPDEAKPVAQATIAAEYRPPTLTEPPAEASFPTALNAEPFTIASLPLSQYELYDSQQVEYLPIRYGTPSSDSHNEGNQNDAIICSF